MTVDRSPTQGPPKRATLPVQDPTGRPVKELMTLYDVPHDTAVMLADATLVDDAWIAEASDRQTQTVRKWRRNRAIDIAAGRNPDTNPNAMISPDGKLGTSHGYKRGRVLLWLIATLRFDAYERQAVHHKGYGRQVGV